MLAKFCLVVVFFTIPLTYCLWTTLIFYLALLLMPIDFFLPCAFLFPDHLAQEMLFTSHNLYVKTIAKEIKRRLIN